MIPEAGSYPPTMSTSPVLNRVAVWPARAVCKAPVVGVKVCATGSYSSAELDADRVASRPPTIRTKPLLRSVAVCSARAEFMLPADVRNVLLAGSYISALFRTPLLLVPPLRKTVPSVKRVAVWPERAAARLPEVGAKLGGSTVKPAPLLATPLTVTTTLPVEAPPGTVVMIDPALQVVMVAAVPLNVTVLVSWLEPKSAPVIVTGSPTRPEFDESPVILGVARTVKGVPLLGTPLTVTTTLPVVAAAGTAATMEPSFQLVVAVASAPLKVTVLPPWLAPKLAPEMVRVVPDTPEVGDRLVMFGVASTVKLMPLLATPFAVTTTFPVVAPTGTAATIEPAVQLVIMPTGVPLKVRVPGLAPKFEPVMVTELPIGPAVGVSPVIPGVASTVNGEPLLGTPLTVTTTFPVVAPAGTAATTEVAVQVVNTLAATPLKATVLVPLADPKFVPVIVTELPTGPEVGERPVIAGVGTTVKLAPLLGTPLTVTTTFPVVADAGTGALIEVALQLVGVEVTPLNVTVLPA